MYLDNAATTLPKPRQVIEAVCGAMNTFGNPSRGAHAPALDALRCLAETRGQLASFFHAESESGIAFTPNATAALNTAIGGITGHIVTTAAEHNSVLRPLFRRGGCTVVPVDSAGRLDMDRLETALRPDTAAVVLTHASNVTGNVFDMAAAGDICRRRGVRLIVDAAQSAGLLDIDCAGWGVSALCFSGHKSLYGPQGTGGICLGEGYLPPAPFVGGSGSDSFSPAHPDRMPDALEAGTQNAHGVAGLLEGVRYVRSRKGACFSDADRAARRFIHRMCALPDYTLYGDLHAPVRTPVIALNHRSIDSAHLAYHLSQRYGIAVRAGAHCAPLLHEALGTRERGAVRVSFSHHHTVEDADRAADAFSQLAREEG